MYISDYQFDLFHHTFLLKLFNKRSAFNKKFICPDSCSGILLFRKVQRVLLILIHPETQILCSRYLLARIPLSSSQLKAPTLHKNIALKNQSILSLFKNVRILQKSSFFDLTQSSNSFFLVTTVLIFSKIVSIRKFTHVEED